MTATDYGSYYRGIPHCALREHVIWLSNCVMLNIIKVPSTQWNFSLIIFYLPATNMVADRSSIEGHGLESSAVKDNLPVDLETAAIKAEGELLDHGADRASSVSGDSSSHDDSPWSVSYTHLRTHETDS